MAYRTQRGFAASDLRRSAPTGSFRSGRSFFFPCATGQAVWWAGAGGCGGSVGAGGDVAVGGGGVEGELRAGAGVGEGVVDAAVGGAGVKGGRGGAGGAGGDAPCWGLVEGAVGMA
ncbi:hypothetical protein GCM10018773_14980 [Streptomyces candidus]|nr:hypothetical protein GCM10018773_14980 [Streptomyces candidus]